jgi:hypothetical protein
MTPPVSFHLSQFDGNLILMKSLDANHPGTHLSGHSYREWQRDWPDEATATGSRTRKRRERQGAKSSFGAKAPQTDEM